MVAPHPDDETLGAGCLLHEAARLGARCAVICLTDGGASHPGSRLWPPERMARAREAELRAAVAALAPGAAVAALGLPDGGLPEGGAEAEAAAARIAAAIPEGALVVHA